MNTRLVAAAAVVVILLIFLIYYFVMPSGPNYELVSFKYGAGSVIVDLTTKAAPLLDQTSGMMTISIKTVGDPVPNVVKTGTIMYNKKGVLQPAYTYKDVQDGVPFKLP